MSESVHHPAHYGGEDDPYEVIKVMRAWLTSEEYIGALKFNIHKYLARERKKGNSEDVAKAAWYAAELKRFVEDQSGPAIMKLIAIRGHTHDHVSPGRCRFCAGWGKLQPHGILASGERAEGEVCQVCQGSGEIRPKPSSPLDPLEPPPLAQPEDETPGRA